MNTVAVLGGGISGLTTAYYLATLGKGLFNKITLFEGSSRLGGWLGSTRRENGCIHEHGTRSIRPFGVAGKNTLNLLDELGLENEVIAVKRSEPAAKLRYLYVNNKLHKFRFNATSFLLKGGPLPLPLAFYVIRELKTKSVKKDDESVHAFFSRRVGDDVANVVSDAMCRGICAGDARKISVKSLFPQMFEAEQEHGSIIKGIFNNTVEAKKLEKKAEAFASPLMKKSKLWATLSLRMGMEQLPERLTEVLLEEGVEVIIDAPVINLHFSGELVELNFKGQSVQTNHIFSAIPSNNLASLLQQEHSSLSSLLKSISSVSVAVVNLEYAGNLLSVKGFGYLVPSLEKSKVLGVVFDSNTFPEHNGHEDEAVTRLSVMLGGEWFEEHFGSVLHVNKDDILKVAIEEVQGVLKIKDPPQWHQVTINENCIPQYYLGHSVTVNSIEAYVRNSKLPMSLVGASYSGIAVNECIYNSKRAVEQYLDKLKYHQN